MEKLGAKVHLCSESDSNEPGGWIYEARQHFEALGPSGIYLDQFDNPNNTLIHQETTAPELFNQFFKIGRRLDYLFLGVGSGGTLEGFLDFIRVNRLRTKVVVIEPIGGVLQGAYQGHRVTYQDHKIESISGSFVPRNLTDLAAISDVYQLEDQAVLEGEASFIEREGKLLGETAAFIYAGLTRYLESMQLTGQTVCFLNTDSGMRYL